MADKKGKTTKNRTAGTGKKKPAASTGNRTSAKDSKDTRSAARAPRGEMRPLNRDIVLCLVFVFCVILFLSNFSITGVAGKAIGRFMKGVFGVMAYPMPFIIFFTYAFYLANRKHHHITQILIGIILCTLFGCAFFQLVLSGFYKGTPLMD